MEVTETIVSDAGGQVNGQPIYVKGAERIEIQAVGPANLFGLQVSQDRNAWFAAVDIIGVAIAAIVMVGGTAHRSVGSRPNWVRGIVATDAGGPQDFVWHLTVTMPE